MQLSQLYRRGVVRPLNDAATSQLKDCRITTSLRAEWLPVLDDEHFAMIWESGILQRISETCCIKISDYEEVELPVSQLNAALKSISNISTSETADVAVFAQNLKAMIVDAIDSKKPLYFVL